MEMPPMLRGSGSTSLPSSKGCPTPALERRQFGTAAPILLVQRLPPSLMHLWAKVSGTFPGLWHLSTPPSSHTWSGHVGTRITGRRAVIFEKPGGASRDFLARVTPPPPPKKPNNNNCVFWAQICEQFTRLTV